MYLAKYKRTDVNRGVLIADYIRAEMNTIFDDY